MDVQLPDNPYSVFSLQNFYIILYLQGMTVDLACFS